jgi:hypothetical protein
MIFDEPSELPSSVVEIFYARHGADIIMQTNYASRDINGCNHVYLHELPCLVAQSICTQWYILLKLFSLKRRLMFIIKAKNYFE